MFKTAIYVLRQYEKKLLEMSFEELINFLSEIPKTEIFINEKVKAYIQNQAKNENERDATIECPIEHNIICNFKTELAKINIPKRLLADIEGDYDRTKHRVENRGKF